MSTIADNLRRLRRQRGLSQMALSHEAGVGQQTVARIEAGVYQPRTQTLQALAAALGCGAGEFFASNPQASGPQAGQEERA